MVLQLRLSATVAPYIDAIKKKRAAGWRWSDIRKALNVECTDRGFGQAVRRCKWKTEQLPLPEPVQQKKGAMNPALVPETKANPAETQNANAGAGDVDYGGFDKPKPKRVFDDD